jgi:uncharacterized protein (TIGR02147 family)
MPPKSVFEYDNYREFLRDTYLHSKARSSKFSYRYFARLAGFKSSGFLKLVMEGKSDLSRKSIEKIATALKLNREEASFFKNLVLFNQANSIQERERYGSELLRSKTFQKTHPIDVAQSRFFSHWYYAVIRGMVGLPGFQEDPDWIAQRVLPPIAPAEAAAALSELEKLGMVRRDPTTGKISQAHANIATPREVVSSVAVKYHRDMIQRASASIDLVSRDQREISASTLGITVQTAKKIKEMIQKFREEVVALAARDTGGEEIYQANFHLFPLTRLSGKKDKV